MANIGPEVKYTTEHVEMHTTTPDAARRAAATRQVEYEKQLSFFRTLAIFWRSTLWILYGQLVVFGYGIDGLIAGNLLAIPRFRCVPLLPNRSKRLRLIPCTLERITVSL